jgi:hypothetical protein
MKNVMIQNINPLEHDDIQVYLYNVSYLYIYWNYDIQSGSQNFHISSLWFIPDEYKYWLFSHDKHNSSVGILDHEAVVEKLKFWKCM